MGVGRLRDKCCFVRREPVHLRISWSSAYLACGMPGLRARFEGVCLHGWLVTSGVFEPDAALHIVHAASSAASACSSYSKTPLAATRHVWVWLLCLQPVRVRVFEVQAGLFASWKCCFVDGCSGTLLHGRGEEEGV